MINGSVLENKTTIPIRNNTIEVQAVGLFFRTWYHVYSTRFIVKVLSHYQITLSVTFVCSFFYISKICLDPNLLYLYYIILSLKRIMPETPVFRWTAQRTTLLNDLNRVYTTWCFYTNLFGSINNLLYI